MARGAFSVETIPFGMERRANAAVGTPSSGYFTVGARGRLHDVPAHLGKGLAHGREQALAVVAHHAQVPRPVELAVDVPGDVHPALRVGLHRLATALHVDGDAAPAGDEADDRIARYRGAALSVAHQHVVHSADAHSAA